jgi:murein DD-endopeptidase MepM/ murein hydrolase activator NlpD
MSLKTFVLTLIAPARTVPDGHSGEANLLKTYSSGVRHDYKEGAVSASGKRVRQAMMFIAGLALPVLAVALLYVGRAEQSGTRPSAEVAARAIGPSEVPTVEPEPIPAEPAVPEAAASDLSGPVLELLVAKGDTLESLFRRNGLSVGDLADLVALPEVGRGLRLVKPGDRLEIAHDGDSVVALRRELDDVHVLTIARKGSGFEASTLERQIEMRPIGAHGTVRSSLFEAGVQAGVSDKLVMDLAGIFEWDIDFIQDVREGDEFTVLYEEIWRDGVKLRNGEIVAAEFVNQGKSYRAARYRDPNGRSSYYTPDGHSLRKAFIRAPLNFTRISSNFDANRKHPILNTIRAHQGVDYAAPIGTPIRAAGDGKVLFRGVQGGYGNVIILQHGNNITTLYGHMSKFANVRVGGRVAQGEVIGYVGQSGLATGPHLHYEYRVNGVHRNPRTVSLPTADPVPPQFQEDFKSTTATLWRQLDLYANGTSTVAAD